MLEICSKKWDTLIDVIIELQLIRFNLSVISEGFTVISTKVYARIKGENYYKSVITKMFGIILGLCISVILFCVKSVQ